MKKFLSLTLALCMVCACAAPALALDIPGGEAATGPEAVQEEIAQSRAAGADVWDGVAIADSFASGDGTQETPYQIATGAQLAKLANDLKSGAQRYHGAYFELANDIDLNHKPWTPIGYQEWRIENGNYSTMNAHPFVGHFDGKGHTVSNVYVADPTGEGNEETGFYAGLFGLVSASAQGGDLLPVLTEIKNLTIDGAAIRGKYMCGALAGEISGGGGSNYQVSVENCTLNNVDVWGPDSISNHIGAVAGGAYAGTVDNVRVAGDKTEVYGSGRVGGFFGSTGTQNVVVQNCATNAKVTGEWAVGGFAGEAWDHVQITNCTSTGNVEAYDWRAGGFVGYVESGSQLTGCVAQGDVTSYLDYDTPYTGGFAGQLASNGDENKVTNCYALGAVVSTVNQPVGGFAGAVDEGGAALSGSGFDQQKNPALDADAAGSVQGAHGLTTEALQQALGAIRDGQVTENEHVYVWEVTQEPTAEEEGVRTGTCIYHGETTTEAIPRLAAPATPDTAVALDKTELSLEPGQTAKLKATLTPADATYKYIFWESSDEAIATVTDSGLVTAIADGTATVTAKSWYGHEAVCTVTVKTPDEPTPPDPVDPWPTEGLEGFVTRCYRVALSRDPDKAGHADWVRWLKDGTVDATSCTYGFVFSKEMNNKNLSEEAFVKTLYNLFMDRDGEPTGVAFWTSYLQDGHSREEVFYGFADSTEFARIKANYGIQ